ncbi:unnamed protein product [Soboliphyme baturini]|uniref:Zinc finger protein unc-98 n=1 Tax=Soboliphyme baturini TaxID=241478 RepID=A0A183IGM0_9BILA|nr:unnamed protein product [Soboliphyme baturini]
METVMDAVNEAIEGSIPSMPPPEGDPGVKSFDETEKESHGQVYKCRFCGLVYNYLTTLRAHERVHDVEEPYVCAKCGISYRFYSELEIHSKEHTGQYTYKCECGRSFAKYSDLLYHEHPGEDEEEHVDAVVLSHKEPPTKYYPDARRFYYCQFCCKGFASSRELKYHLYSHRGERAFTVGSSRYLMNRI